MSRKPRSLDSSAKTPKTLTAKQKVAAYEKFLNKLANWEKPLWFLSESAVVAEEARKVLNEVRGPREEEIPPTERDPIPATLQTEA